MVGDWTADRPAAALFRARS